MTDIILDTPDISVFGGPSSISVNVGTGLQGPRGTYIFTGTQRPNDKDSDTFLDNATTPAVSKQVQPKDLYINLNPSDQEYLYLYQYDQNANGTYQWKKTLRLVPNTAIANIDVPFFNGQAVRYVNVLGTPSFAEIDWQSVTISLTAPSSPTSNQLWLDISIESPTLKKYVSSAWVLQGTVYYGQLFPLSSYFDLTQLGSPIDTSKFNIQYSILNPNNKAIASSVTVGGSTYADTLATYLPITVVAHEATNTNGTITWAPITGIQKVHLLITAGV